MHVAEPIAPWSGQEAGRGGGVTDGSLIRPVGDHPLRSAAAVADELRQPPG